MILCWGLALAQENLGVDEFDCVTKGGFPGTMEMCPRFCLSRSHMVPGRKIGNPLACWDPEHNTPTQLERSHLGPGKWKQSAL